MTFESPCIRALVRISHQIPSFHFNYETFKFCFANFCFAPLFRWLLFLRLLIKLTLRLLTANKTNKPRKRVITVGFQSEIRVFYVRFVLINSSCQKMSTFPLVAFRIDRYHRTLINSDKLSDLLLPFCPKDQKAIQFLASFCFSVKPLKVIKTIGI